MNASDSATDQGTSDSTKDEAKFSTGIRVLLGGLGLLLVVGGLAFWIWPVDHTKPAPSSAKCTAAKDCFVKVDDAPEILLSSLVVLGALLFLIGANGRTLSKFTGPGDTGFETMAAAQEADAAEKAGEKAAQRQDLDPAEKQVAVPLAAEKARSRTRRELLGRRRPLAADEIDSIATQVADEAAGTLRRQ